MKIVMLDKATLGDDLDISALNAFGNVTVYDKTEPDEVTSRIKEAEIIFLNKVKLTEKVLLCAENLKLICEAATGYDNINTEYCRKNNIAVCNVPGYSANSVSQITVSMVLSLACHLKEYNEYTKSGKYTLSGVQNCLTPVFHELNGKTWGIIGYGNIGTKVSDAAKALGCKVIVNKRTATDDVCCVDIDTLIQKSDIISVHIPLSDETTNIINSKRISMMKDNVIFINVARGAVVDETALCRAVLDGKIGAVGIDVYSAEPFDNSSPFYKIKDLDNVCLTPHMAWGAVESRIRCFNIMIENVKAFLNGETKNRVE